MLAPRNKSPCVCLTVSLGCAIAAVFIGAGGCGGSGGPERVLVSGNVTYQGQPITNGMIRFRPVETSQAPMAGAVILNGNYKVDGHGGVSIGTFRVEIEAYRKASPRAPAQNSSSAESPIMPMVMIPPEQYLSNRHNADSQLQVTIEPGSGRITKNFNLTD